MLKSLATITVTLAFSFILLTATRAKADDPMDFWVVSKADLTRAFDTTTNWNLVITQEPHNFLGDLHFCFVHDGEAVCSLVCAPSGVALGDYPTCVTNGSDTAFNMLVWVSTFRSIGRAKANLVVADVARSKKSLSRLPDGLVIWAFHRQSDSFERIFSAVQDIDFKSTQNGRSEDEIRFISSGPLAGDVVLDRAASFWPYRYEIVVYQLLSSERYVKVLDYLGKATEGDKNALWPIDAEMPEIEKRLGYWEPGDPLPVSPKAASPECKTPVRLQDGLAWCDGSQ